MIDIEKWANEFRYELPRDYKVVNEKLRSCAAEVLRDAAHTLPDYGKEDVKWAYRQIKALAARYEEGRHD